MFVFAQPWFGFIAIFMQIQNKMSFTLKKDIKFDLYGFSGVAMGQNFVETAFSLMDRMWKVVKTHDLKNKGINVWVYDANNLMFSGVELEAPPPSDLALEHKMIHFPEYLSYTHIGPYEHIKEVYSRLTEEFRQKGIKTRPPYLEVYGHMTPDTSKLETDLLWAL